VVKFSLISSKLREKRISTKSLTGKYQISKSRGTFPLFPPSETHDGLMSLRNSFGAY